MPAGRRAWELADLSWKSCLVGAIAGVGAVGFRDLIGLFHNLAFAGHLSLRYDANLHTAPSRWGALIILVPVAGALVVAFLVQRFAPEAKGHGVPEVMDAIYYHQARIRPVVALVKALASSISIATGGSVGREGPIAQIGAAFGSTLGGWLKLPVWQRATLVAAGAGAGIAATFNTPIGGVLFAVELLLVEVNARTLLPVSLAVAIATLVGRAAFGGSPAFVVTPSGGRFIIGAGAFGVFIVFGVLIGACAALYARSIYWVEDRFDAIPGGYYVRHLLGMLLVGLLLYLLLRATGHYYVEGVGYATLQDILDELLRNPWLLLLLFVAKLLATSVTLGSGASGGVFSPALFLGGCVGGAFGWLVGVLLPSLGTTTPLFAIAGMAGLAGASMSAALTALTMLFEMTRSYEVVVPMLVTVVVAYASRRVLLRESVYTFKLRRRGHHVSQALMSELALAQSVRAVADRHVLATDGKADWRQLLLHNAEARYFVVARGDEPPLLLRRDTLLEAIARDQPIEPEALGERYCFVEASASVREALATLEQVDVGLLRDEPLAVVTRRILWRALEREAELIDLGA